MNIDKEFLETFSIIFIIIFYYSSMLTVIKNYIIDLVKKIISIVCNVLAIECMNDIKVGVVIIQLLFA